MTAVPASSADSRHGGAVAVGGDVEVGRHAEVALAAGGELDLAADARDAERAPAVVVGLAVQVVADHVPDAVQLEQAVRVDGALGLGVGADRPVAEPHGALLRDRLLELGQPLGDLVGVERAQQLDGGRLRARVGARPGPARARGSAARAAAARRRRTGPRAGRSSSAAPPARRRSARPAAGSTAPRAGCRAPPTVNSSRTDAIGTPSPWSSARSA